jgi:predicted nucleic acid-binding protein
VTVFLDTSALLAQLNRADDEHERSVDAFARLVREDRLLTHNYAIVETMALAQSRLGFDAVRALLRDIIPLVEVHWIDQTIHEAATIALLASGRRETSFVDWTSFEVMRRSAIEVAFAFDRDFARQGFRLVP